MLWGQRKCSYPGQYAPELLTAIDEYANDDNPDYINDEFVKHQDSDEFDSLEIMSSLVSDKEIKSLLNPKNDVSMIGLFKEDKPA
jgi:hypothetical protein